MYLPISEALHLTFSVAKHQGAVGPIGLNISQIYSWADLHFISPPIQSAPQQLHIAIRLLSFFSLFSDKYLSRAHGRLTPCQPILSLCHSFITKFMKVLLQ